MAHAGEKMVLRLVQLLDLFLLLYGELLLLLIKMVLEQQQHPREESSHDHRTGGIEIGLGRGVGQHQLRMEIGNVIADQGLHSAQCKEHRLASALQGNADIDEAEHEPLRHPAVDAAPGEEHHGKQ